MRAAKVDLNQKEIVKRLRDAGYSVLLLHAVHGGCPDILVGKDGKNWLFEIKSHNGKLTPKQVEFFDSWGGQAAVARSFEQIAEAIDDS